MNQLLHVIVKIQLISYQMFAPLPLFSSMKRKIHLDRKLMSLLSIVPKIIYKIQIRVSIHCLLIHGVSDNN